jgi:crotonobetainyl-CoA:carnitine CoA-transferase CaiB-like acyl-CoA transferase
VKILSGVKVLEIGSFITAPNAAMQLGNFGADVIKVEKPEGGDDFRMFRGGLYSPHFVANNKNKRSVTLDLRAPDDLAVLMDLIDVADVLLDNFRPGALERLGLGWDALHARNPRLIQCSITGFGGDGPYKDRPAFDTVVSSLSGVLSTSIDPDDPLLNGPTFADNVSAHTAFCGILAALYERSTSNVGRHIEVNMLEALIAFNPGQFAASSMRAEGSSRDSRPANSQAFVLRCADGKLLALHLSTPEKFWKNALQALERPDLADDPRFIKRAKRVENYGELRTEFRAIAATKPRAYWIARLEEFDVPFAPVHQVNEVIGDPQVEQMGTLYQAHHPTEGDVLSVRRPVYIDGERPVDDRPAPALGEHNAELPAILATWRSS